ncbi:FecR domain-containing protein [Fulvitalea axinellae]
MIARRLSGELDEAEKAELRAWMDQDPENRKEVSDLRMLWAMYQDDPAIPPADEAFALVEKKIDKERQAERRHIPWGRIAATVALVLALGASLWVGGLQEYLLGGEMLTIRTAEGQRAKLTLPDGTKVTLNGKSKVEYPEVFGIGSRRVKIEGEAYFDVAHDKDKPFYVKFGEFETKVLGTAFDIRAFKAEKEFSVALVSGSVMISGKGEVILEPGQRYRVSKNGEALVESFVPSEDLLWKNHFFEFDNRKIDDVLAELSAWFGLEISVENPHRWENITLTGNFKAKEFEQVMRHLDFIANISYRKTGDKRYVVRQRSK